MYNMVGASSFVHRAILVASSDAVALKANWPYIIFRLRRLNLTTNSRPRRVRVGSKPCPWLRAPRDQWEGILLHRNSGCHKPLPFLKCRCSRPKKFPRPIRRSYRGVLLPLDVESLRFVLAPQRRYAVTILTQGQATSGFEDHVLICQRQKPLAKAAPTHGKV